VLDVCVTAIRRPEVLELTLRSFSKRLKAAPPFRIILNIDPLGDGSADDVIECASRFATHIEVRVAAKACFPSAVNWAWENVRSDIFLHLEDDWILKKNVDYRAWESALRASRASQSVLLMKKPRTDPGSLRYSFRPHLAKKSVLDEIGTIPNLVNPEVYAGSQLSFVQTIDYGQEFCVEDIGRKWSKFRGLEKKGDIENWFARRPRNVLTWAEQRLCWMRWRYLVSRDR